MSSSKIPLINTLISRYSGKINYRAGDDFYWRPDTKTIFYISSTLENINSQAQLLHETAHALLGHTSYNFDVELLGKELEAWEKAKLLGNELELSVGISESHLESCLDSYRDWLHRRSTCIECSHISLEIEPHTYKCFNCLSTWQVPVSSICRRKSI